VLHAVDRVTVPASGGAGGALDAAADRLGDSVDASCELLEGDAGAALVERAADLDLLVAGSKGHGPLGRALRGSVSHHLMCNSPAPVLVVPPE
jgi:nucleotide-binding universal stress UspA family protein